MNYNTFNNILVESSASKEFKNYFKQKTAGVNSIRRMIFGDINAASNKRNWNFLKKVLSTTVNDSSQLIPGTVVGSLSGFAFKFIKSPSKKKLLLAIKWEIDHTNDENKKKFLEKQFEKYSNMSEVAIKSKFALSGALKGALIGGSISFVNLLKKTATDRQIRTDMLYPEIKDNIKVSSKARKLHSELTKRAKSILDASYNKSKNTYNLSKDDLKKYGDYIHSRDLIYRSKYQSMNH